jgi:uncharacterized protein
VDSSSGSGLQTETFELILETRAGKFFWLITGHPKKVVVAALLAVLAIGSFLPRLYKDTSAEAFIADDDPAVAYRRQVEETFGLADPVIVAVTRPAEGGIFTAEGLNVVASLTKQIRALEGVDPDRVTSLYTENNIVGDVAGIEVRPFYEGRIETDEEALEVREAVFRFPLYQGSLVANDGSATLIVAELLDPEKGAEVFHQVSAMGDLLTSRSIHVYVAGEGAVAEYLGEYIDADSRRLYPLIGLTIIVILFVAFRSPRGIFIPLFMVIGSVLVALGAMAGAGVPIYLITNALPVILIAIGVADGIHILSEYYEEIALRPDSGKREPIVRAMVELWRAILYTSVTDAAGFLALALVSFMPPMQAFGTYAAIGVMAAGCFSLLVMPALLMLLPARQSGAFKSHVRDGHEAHYDRFGAVMYWMGGRVVKYPRAVAAASIVFALLGIAGALQLRVDYARIDYFHASEPIYKADQLINERFDGSNFIDVVVEAPEADGLLRADAMTRIEALQRYAESLTYVGGTTSIVDYVKQMNRALFEDDEAEYRIPEEDTLIAKYFLLFAATGDPDSLSKVVDYDYRMANIRIALQEGSYSKIKTVVEPLEEYLEDNFSDTALTASVAGRANVTYHWIKDIAESHFLSVAVALLAVWVCASFSFRSSVAGLYAITPVVLAVLANYAAMGAFGITLGVGTSMFAAIGIGISVNFAIHALHRTIELVHDYEEDLEAALIKLFPVTGRALLFNCAATCLGFSVLMSSQISALRDFGLLVAAVTLTSFVASVTALPALLLVFRPRFLRPGARTRGAV